MTATEIRRLAPTLADLLALLRGPTAPDYSGPVLSERELTRLPTYGGREPRSTSGVWSWDARRLLVGTCAEDYQIVPRPLCREYGCERVVDTAGSGDGLCPPHYQQRRRIGETKPVRVPAAGRIGVRVDAETAAWLGDRPAVRAREALEGLAARVDDIERVAKWAEARAEQARVFADAGNAATARGFALEAAQGMREIQLLISRARSCGEWPPTR